MKKRPYELKGPAYALWYEVGQKLGIQQQSAVAHVLCDENKKLPPLDLLSVVRINQIAAAHGMIFEMA